MTHISGNDVEQQEILRLAGVLDVTVAEATETVAAFRQVFWNTERERQIFDMIAKLDADAEERGDQAGLGVWYEVEVRPGGVKVGRWTDKLPEDETEPDPAPNNAAIFLKISDGSRDRKWYGPLMLRRPEPEVESTESELSIRERYPESEWAEWIVCDIKPRWSFPERFPFVVGSVIAAQNAASSLEATAAASAMTAAERGSGNSLSSLAWSDSGHPVSGLSPPAAIGDPRTLRPKAAPPLFNQTPAGV